MTDKKRLGADGEDHAAAYLQQKKYKIIARNYKTSFGEIDIIAKDREYIVFVEVKTRTSLLYGLPCQAVDARKQRVIGKVAVAYLVKNKMANCNCRFDVIEVLSANEKTSVTHIIDAFQPSAI